MTNQSQKQTLKKVEYGYADTVLFWGDKPQGKISPFKRLRNFIWFYPDYIAKIIHRTRPLSYLFLFGAAALLIWQISLYAVSQQNTIFNPIVSQTLEEGFVGHVSKINPIYITHNQIERDLQTLIFNKLIKIGKDGNPKPDLAETWAVSSDGKTYTFFLREDVHWHDGEEFSAADVIFTFRTLQKTSGEDSYADAFENIDINSPDKYTVEFVLPEVNATFMESLAIGIIPEHHFKGVPVRNIKNSQFNKLPIGTGPFKIEENLGTHILLTKNSKYFKGSPKLKSIKYIFYPTEKEALTAFKLFEIHTINLQDPETTKELSEYTTFAKISFPMPLRSKNIYFNLRREDQSYSSDFIRQAVSMAINRDEIVSELESAGSESTGPIYEESWAYDPDISRYQYNRDSANELLESGGWKYPDEHSQYREKDGKRLTLYLTFLSTQQNLQLVDILEIQLAEIGIELIPSAQEYEKLVTEILPRRDFDLLIFEIETTPDPDKYNLWHSSKSEYPGLNVSGYSYERVDILLERARKEIDVDERNEDYRLFQKYIMRDLPAIYLYHPNHVFYTHRKVRNIEVDQATLPQDRYNNVIEWYIGR